MTTLHDRLADLVDDLPTPPPGDDLWERGRRFHRLRRGGTLAIVATAVLALVAIAGLTWQRSSAPSPAPTPAGSPVGLPDRFYPPSPWLPGTDDAGPLGRLIAVVQAERGGWGGTRQGVVGISASTGDYRFLDLPDLAGGAVLSADGRHVAYWVTGAVSGSAHVGSAPVVGVAVYDTVTGHVERQVVPTEHGLEASYLAWVDTDHVIFTAGQWMGGRGDSEMAQSMSNRYVTRVWELGVAIRRVRLPGEASPESGASNAAGLVVVPVDAPGPAYEILSLTHPVAPRQVSTDRSFVSPPVFDRTGTTMAMVGASNPGRSTKVPNSVMVGAIPSSGSLDTGPGALRRVPRSGRTFAVLTWLPGGDLLVSRLFRRSFDGLDEQGLYRLDPATGHRRLVSRLGPAFVQSYSFALDLLDAPTVPGRRPPSPLDPRLVTGLSVTTVVGAVAGLVLWRRRVRP